MVGAAREVKGEKEEGEEWLREALDREMQKQTIQLAHVNEILRDVEEQAQEGVGRLPESVEGRIRGGTMSEESKFVEEAMKREIERELDRLALEELRDELEDLKKLRLRRAKARMLAELKRYADELGVELEELLGEKTRAKRKESSEEVITQLALADKEKLKELDPETLLKLKILTAKNIDPVIALLALGLGEKKAERGDIETAKLYLELAKDFIEKYASKSPDKELLKEIIELRERLHEQERKALLEEIKELRNAILRLAEQQPQKELTVKDLVSLKNTLKELGFVVKPAGVEKAPSVEEKEVEYKHKVELKKLEVEERLTEQILAMLPSLIQSLTQQQTPPTPPPQYTPPSPPVPSEVRESIKRRLMSE